ncbi:hypothetical protein PRZ48_008343 [Zasmidium cellare]|uniref:Ribokinase n=1 Tax=Zasmidium cellare TaxID=395010 RepID=A0ABR0EF96_ZASCE|nr:hypothetical protein PRZ48_008343 [Zasmidium cellare]
MANPMPSACIAVVGTLLSEQFMVTDRMPDLGESYPANSYATALGGKGANAAMAAFRSCHKKPEGGVVVIGKEEKTDVDISVRMIGAVGEDDYATRFRSTLLENGIDVSGIRTVPGALTGTCFCIVEEDSRDNRLLYHVGATNTFSQEDFMSAKALGEGQKPDLLISQLEIDTKVVERLLDMASDANIDILLNAAPACTVLTEKYRLLTHLIVNETEAAILSGRDIDEVNSETWGVIAQEFLALGAKNVVITLGAEGAFYANRDSSGHVPAFEIEVLDPTGAGDAFTGAYATEYVRQKELWGYFDIEKAVVRGCKAGALVVNAIGSQTSMPWSEDIDGFATKSSEQLDQ